MNSEVAAAAASAAAAVAAAATAAAAAAAAAADLSQTWLAFFRSNHLVRDVATFSHETRSEQSIFGWLLKKQNDAKEMLNKNWREEVNGIELYQTRGTQ